MPPNRPSIIPYFLLSSHHVHYVVLLNYVILLFLLPCVSSHGMMCTPRQRGAYISQKCGYDLDIPKDPVIDYCAHCLNGGTVATVRGNLPPEGWKIYEPIKDFDGTAKRAGLCGDPIGTGAHMIGGDFMPSRYVNIPMVAHYKTGGYIDFVAEIDTNHNGYFEYFLCDLDSCQQNDIHQNCFKQGHCYKLNRVKHPDCEDPNQNTHYECGPIDENYPGRWYLPCRNTGHVGVHIVGGPSGTMRYKLPNHVSCKHCVIQWYWATANSCAPRGLLDFMKRKNNPFGTTCASDGGGRGTFRHGMIECGGTNVPEEFWSCADVQITKDGKSVGPVKAVGEPIVNKQPSEEDRLKKDPLGVKKQAEDKLKKDIQDEVNGAEKERMNEEEAARKGLCLLEGSKCDGSVRCCDWQQVCVFGALTSSFTCRFWWSLWAEAELMQKEQYHVLNETDVENKLLPTPNDNEEEEEEDDDDDEDIENTPSFTIIPTPVITISSTPSPNPSVSSTFTPIPSSQPSNSPRPSKQYHQQQPNKPRKKWNRNIPKWKKRQNNQRKQWKNRWCNWKCQMWRRRQWNRYRKWLRWQRWRRKQRNMKNRNNQNNKKKY